MKKSQTNNLTMTGKTGILTKIQKTVVKFALATGVFLSGYALTDQVTQENGTIEAQAVAKAQITKTNQTGKKVKVQSSAYTPNCIGCYGRTATGYNIRNTIFYKGYRIIAADTKVFPMGTVLQVPNIGKVVVLDRGGAIKGYKIDILHKTKTNAYKYGRKYGVGVKILGKVSV